MVIAEILFMDRKFLAPFVASLGDTFSTMLSCAIHTKSGQPFFDPPCYHDVSGIISYTGGAEGIVVVSLTREVALKAASALLMDEITELNPDVIDAVGEIANMVAGAAKAKLEAYQIRIGLPSVVTGPKHEVNLPSNLKPLCMGFESAWGEVSLTVGMVLVDTPVLV
jgi:chemotaxis protein CheX